jgi:hypothetical protein
MLPMRAFLLRLLGQFLLALAVAAFSLLLGTAGYHYIEGLSWIDALLNAAMLLGGMGPVNELHTNAGKLFATFYALYSGMIFLVIAGLLLAPVFHRVLHHFHLEVTEDDVPQDHPSAVAGPRGPGSPEPIPPPGNETNDRPGF